MRRLEVIVGVVLSTVVLSAVSPPPAIAQVTMVTGSAFGFYASVGLFGGPPGVNGPLPAVTLPPGGSAEPVTETDPDGGTAQYGPAVIVQTMAMTVSTEGTTGPEGSVTSSSSVEFDLDQEQQVDPFNADELLSSCTADESGLTGSSRLTKASLVLSTDPETQEPSETIPLPENPAPNTAFEGTIDHVGDRFRVVLNEQIEEGGTITVNAMHLYLLGNIAVGDAIIGQSVCGVNATSGGATPTTGAGAGTPDTTAPPGTTTPASDATTDSSRLEGAATADTGEDAGGAGALLPAGLVVGGLALVGLVVKLVAGGRAGGSGG